MFLIKKSKIEKNSNTLINLLGIKKRKNILVGIKKRKNILVGIKKNILIQVLNCRRQFKKWV